MRTSIKYLCALLFLTATSQIAYAQDAEMADAFRADGKIYVVVAIILIVLTGLIVYLFLVDRKLNRLERMINNKKQTKTQGNSF